MIEYNQAHDLADLIVKNYRAFNHSPTDSPYVIAIDGPCASGKTVLSKDIKHLIESKYNISVGLIELDHFFLPPELRSSRRLAEAGGNIHYERFLEEVVQPLMQGDVITYRRFDCQSLKYAEEYSLVKNEIILFEGVYSHHPKWHDILDFTIFCTADLPLRLQRIEQRDGPVKLEQFINKWIPMEDKYFSCYDIRNQADAIWQS